ncbi:MAG: saccharopine dehydrogenase NADP-binding domain-containing protein [Acidobacteria bacterium]|nr:saccharopine dehydrogenase NADP-binding domain-containing protein [Acidobacteriota bacterium]MCA1639901.1 saccharopine dehydrogenase NADP-binding domain-containing protein [Acidobacteriota bacterium]
MEKNFLIYGASGYTGELVAREAARRGLKPILSGRSQANVEPLAKELDLTFRTFSLEDRKSLEYTLKEVEFVLHCAGPFSLTSKPMVEACLRTGKHYLDITGEIAVFEALARRDKQAKEAGIMIMPGVGFDVVPSDCLALHLKNRLPSAAHLTLAFYGLGKISHGTQATMTMNVGKGGAIRKNGEIVNVPAAWKTREIAFGEFTKTGVTIPWGDVATAFYSTGIPNIEVYTVLPETNLRMLKLSRYIGWLLATKPMQSYLQKQIPEGGPNEKERAKGKTFLWGEAKDEQGNRVEAHLQCPEGYTLTALTALNITEKVINGNYKTGFQTPAKAYGADLILEIEGVSISD